MKNAGPDIRVVIMAGGSGTRFWPLSRKRSPKQFLPITSSRTMIEETVRRVLPLVPRTKIHTVANADQTRTIRRLLLRIPERNFLVEPQGRNTAPSLILATAWVYLQNPEAVVAVLPSDHLIADPEAFLKRFEAAATAAAVEDALVTFGVRPTFPSTGFGYIRFHRDKARRISGDAFYDVASFHEKPSLETALEFLKSGNYFWNSGMFLWRADVFARKLDLYAPEFSAFWTRMLDALRSKSKTALATLFAEIPATSIDYALMERAKGVLVTEGDFGWSDVGAWSALSDIWEKDGAGNAIKGDPVVLDSENVICYSPGKVAALVGVKDLIVVDTKDALLICRKDQDQRVKEILDILAKSGKAGIL
jgi:mannose-1-phosphate guanylyltransferase